MKKFYCVTSSVDDCGRCTAAITAECEAGTKPESKFTSTSRKDIYSDWFGSLSEAREFAKSAREA